MPETGHTLPPVDTLTAAAIAVTTTLIILMDWVPTPLNRNISGMTTRERLPSTVIHGLLGVLFVSANLLEWTWVVLLGAIWYSLVLAQAIRNWWVAYLFGIYGGEITPEDFRDHYSDNVRILPKVGDHPVVPDLQHVLIHVSVLFAAALSWVSFVDLLRS
jgi:hypothetical protein